MQYGGVIPAKAGLRRQDAGANSEAGPEGTPQERRVIHPDLDAIKKYNMDSRLTSSAVESRGNDGS